jgi:hypothetical protein
MDFRTYIVSGTAYYRTNMLLQWNWKEDSNSDSETKCKETVTMAEMEIEKVEISKLKSNY